MSNGYKVDLSALDEVIKDLNSIVDGMGSPKQKARYDTYLPEGWLGKGLVEEHTFRTAHNNMKDRSEGYIGALEKLIEEFGTDTSKVRSNYDKNELDAQGSMSAYR